jgi:hypothetical protein
MELTATFLSRRDAKVEAEQGRQYMMAHVPVVIQYLREHLGQDNTVMLITW